MGEVSDEDMAKANEQLQRLDRVQRRENDRSNAIQGELEKQDKRRHPNPQHWWWRDIRNLHN